MVHAIATLQPSYVPQEEHKLSTVILERQVSNINLHKEQMTQTWVKASCSIVMDGQTSTYQHHSYMSKWAFLS